MTTVRRRPVAWSDVTSRVTAAVVGGYVLTYLATAVLTLSLPLARSEAVLTTGMLSFVLYVGAILWAFAAATPIKAWLGLLIPAILCAAIAYPLGWSVGV